MGRKTLAEVEARRTEVHEMLMQGKTKSFIVSYCASHWGVLLSAVEHDIAAVRDELMKSFHHEKQDIIATHCARYDNLYAFYMNAGNEEDGWNIHYNPEIASKMLEKKEKLLRLHNSDVQVNVHQNIDKQLNMNFSNLSVDEIKEILIKNDNE